MNERPFHELSGAPKIWLHHYYIQSRGAFKLKCDRGRSDKPGAIDFDDLFKKNGEYSEKPCDKMARWVSVLHEHGYMNPVDLLVTHMKNQIVPLIPIELELKPRVPSQPVLPDQVRKYMAF
jgi:hypothetical protein